MKKQKAFTLVELLVVISIIALLMAILMPTLTKVRQQAQAVVCKSNLRQLALFGVMYAVDNDDSFPMGVFVNGQLTYGGQWVDAWRQYYKEPKVLFCPSATKLRFTPPTATVPGPGRWLGAFSAWGMYDRDLIPDVWGSTIEPGHKSAGSYGINSWCANPDRLSRLVHTNWIPKNWRYMTMSNSEEIPFMFDSLNFDARPRLEDEPPNFTGEFAGNVAGTSTGRPDGMRNVCLDRHAETVNVVYVAGNVGKVNLKCLWTLRWNEPYRKSLLKQGKVGLPNEWDVATHWMFSMKNCVPEYLQ